MWSARSRLNNRTDRNMLKPSEEDKKDYAAIRYIDKVYRKGGWALEVDKEVQNKIVSYYKEAVKKLKELEIKEFEEAINSKRKLIVKGKTLTEQF